MKPELLFLLLKKTTTHLELPTHESTNIKKKIAPPSTISISAWEEPPELVGGVGQPRAEQACGGGDGRGREHCQAAEVRGVPGDGGDGHHGELGEAGHRDLRGADQLGLPHGVPRLHHLQPDDAVRHVPQPRRHLHCMHTIMTFTSSDRAQGLHAAVMRIEGSVDGWPYDEAEESEEGAAPRDRAGEEDHDRRAEERALCDQPCRPGLSRCTERRTHTGVRADMIERVIILLG